MKKNLSDERRREKKTGLFPERFPLNPTLELSWPRVACPTCLEGFPNFYCDEDARV